MNTTETVEKHLRYLCETIGERLIGTSGNLKAADYIADVFQAASLEIHRSCFPCPAWECSSAKLSINHHAVEVKVNTFSPACDVTASTIVVFTLDELRQATLKDKILVMCGELTRQPIDSYYVNAVYMPEPAKEIGLLLREKQPLGIILINQTPGYDVLMLEDMRLGIPSVTVSAEEGVKLLEQLPGNATLSIESKTTSGETCNIIGKKHHNQESRRLILGAHYDSRYGTVGAFDNASGVTALLTLVEWFAQHPANVSLEFVAFTAEEYGAEDSFDEPYLKQYGLKLPPYEWGKEIIAPYKPSALDDVIAMLNFDGIGHAISANTISTMSCSEELKAAVAEIKQFFPSLAIVDGWPASNHYAFYSNGIPSLPFNSAGMGNIIHHPKDDLSYISFSKITEVVNFTTQIIEHLQEKTPEWSRAFSLEEARKTFS